MVDPRSNFHQCFLQMNLIKFNQEELNLHFQLINQFIIEQYYVLINHLKLHKDLLISFLKLFIN